jgi:hypothetical protein
MVKRVLPLAALLISASIAAAQDPPVRVDFEGRLPRAAVVPDRSPDTGPPARVDFTGTLAKTVATPESTRPPVTGPPARVDFEGRAARGGIRTTDNPERVKEPPAQAAQAQSPSPARPAPPQNAPSSPSRPPPRGVVVGKPSMAPVIVTVTPACVRPGATFTVTGRGFGVAGTNRRLVFTGQVSDVVLQVRAWNDTQIVATGPSDPRLRPGMRVVVAIQDESRRAISNTNVMVGICSAPGG